LTKQGEPNSLHNALNLLKIYLSATPNAPSGPASGTCQKKPSYSIKRAIKNTTNSVERAIYSVKRAIHSEKSYVFCQLIVSSVPLAALVKKSLLIRFKRLSKEQSILTKEVTNQSKEPCILSKKVYFVSSMSQRSRMSLLAAPVDKQPSIPSKEPSTEQSFAQGPSSHACGTCQERAVYRSLFTGKYKGRFSYTLLPHRSHRWHWSQEPKILSKKRDMTHTGHDSVKCAIPQS